MNRDRMLVGFGVALLVAFLASWYVYRQLQRVQPGPQTPGHVQVVVTAGPVQLGARLAATDVALLDWPEGLKPQGAFVRKEDCIGRVPIVPLVQNEVILDQELAKPEEGAGLSVTIPAGMRAVSVGVDDVVAVAGFVTPGTVVDVLVTGLTSAQQPVTITRTILEHAKVLAVGQQVQTEAGKPQSAPVVTLLVSPEDGEKLTLAASAGRIHLALRNGIDVADVNPAPIYGPTVFQGTPPPTPGVARVVMAKPAPQAPPVPAPYTVQVIHGDKIETQSFPR
jgi:pilus assembly protein CpaB